MKIYKIANAFFQVLSFFQPFIFLTTRNQYPVRMYCKNVASYKWSFIFRKKTIIRTGDNANDIFDEVAIFGGTDKKFHSENLQGGKITTLFGGSNIDLRDSNINGEASIEIFCMFGGVELLVPSNWKVNQDATAILGGVSDERSNIELDTIATLNIRGFVMFGGVELKN